MVTRLHMKCAHKQTVVYEQVVIIAASVAVENFLALERDHGVLGAAMTERCS